MLEETIDMIFLFIWLLKEKTEKELLSNAELMKKTECAIQSFPERFCLYLKSKEFKENKKQNTIRK